MSLVFNSQKAPLSSADVRGALAYYAYSLEHSGANLSLIKQATSLFVDTITYNDQVANQIITASTPVYMNWENPKAQLNAGLQSIGMEKLSGCTLLIPSDSIYTVVFEHINQIWQKELGVFFTVESLPIQEIEKRVAEGNFDVAFINYTPTVNNIFSLMEQYAGFDSSVSSYLSMAQSQTDSSKVTEYIGKAQSIVLNNAYFVPMCENTANYWHRKYFQNVIINPFGNIVNLKYTVAK